MFVLKDLFQKMIGVPWKNNSQAHDLLSYSQGLVSKGDRSVAENNSQAHELHLYMYILCIMKRMIALPMAIRAFFREPTPSEADHPLPNGIFPELRGFLW